VTFPVKLSDDPLQTAAQYPGVTQPRDSVGPHSVYGEGLLVGYRWYDARNITPPLPCGYGLSYTTFRYLPDKRVTRTGSGLSVSFMVTNIGSREGPRPRAFAPWDTSNHAWASVPAPTGYGRLLLARHRRAGIGGATFRSAYTASNPPLDSSARPNG
jgi:hypothetical protein